MLSCTISIIFGGSSFSYFLFFMHVYFSLIVFAFMYYLFLGEIFVTSKFQVRVQIMKIDTAKTSVSVVNYQMIITC